MRRLHRLQRKMNADAKKQAVIVTATWHVVAIIYVSLVESLHLETLHVGFKGDLLLIKTQSCSVGFAAYTRSRKEATISLRLLPTFELVASHNDFSRRPRT